MRKLFKTSVFVSIVAGFFLVWRRRWRPPNRNYKVDSRA